MNQYLAMTPRGIENLFEIELEQCGASNSKVINAGVHFRTDEKRL